MGTHILVVNGGSGSQQLSLFATQDSKVLEKEPTWEARIDTTAPDQPAGKLYISVKTPESSHRPEIDRETTLKQRLEAINRELMHGQNHPISHWDQVAAVGHRVVHGGDRFSRATRLDESVESEIEGLGALSPLHNPPQLAAIRALKEVTGDRLPHYAVFDTAFHRTMPLAASAYAGPYAWLDEKIRKYGFHGSSFRYVTGRVSALLGPDVERKMILCHLGGGCSLAAVRDNASIDTTMGFSPLDGVAMCTRSGAVDPGILLHLMRQGLDADRLEKILNNESGLAGLSGLPGDTRVILPAVRSGNERAKLALDVFIHRLRAGIGNMLASLGGCDVLVFTDVIGETEPSIRAAACLPFAFMGLEIDASANQNTRGDVEISTPRSRVRVFVIKTRESWQIGQETLEALPVRG
jgi:acetate kinase